jgi:IclR family pca regulon transcriptional regulator
MPVMGDTDLRYKTLVDFSNILRLFETQSSDGRSVSDIARSLNMLPSKASRMLKTLDAEGLVERDRSTGRYRVGARPLLLGLTYLESHPLRRIVLPHMEQAAAELGVSVHWAVFIDNRAVVVDRIRIDTPPPVHLFGVGLRLHATSFGKLALAHMPEERLEAVLGPEPYERFTDRTIVSLGEMKAELNRIRVDGCAQDDGELREGSRAISVPVYDESSRLVVAITAFAFGPAERWNPPEVISYLKEKGTFISHQLGYVSSSNALISP